MDDKTFAEIREGGRQLAMQHQREEIERLFGGPTELDAVIDRTLFPKTVDIVWHPESTPASRTYEAWHLAPVLE